MHPINKQQRCSLFCLPCFPFIQFNFLVIFLLVFFNQFTQSKFLLVCRIFLITSREFCSITHYNYISYVHHLLWIFPYVFRMITQNLLMFEIDETRYYYSARVSFRIFFVQRLCSSLRITWMEKSLKFNWRGGWNKNVLSGKISKN